MAKKKTVKKKKTRSKKESKKRRKLEIIGVIHLPPLPGAPQAEDIPVDELLNRAGLQAIKEAQFFQKSGFNGVIIENFGDAPFEKNQVPSETIVAMGVIASAVRESVKIPVGINILRNDSESALSVAAVTGCDFIRVNVLSGVSATDQGIIEGKASLLLKKRRFFRSEVQIFADVHVKHAISLSSQDLILSIEENVYRGGAEQVILTGETTGRSVDLEELEKASEYCIKNKIPLWIGSGATPENLHLFEGKVTGIIVGSTLRKGGKAGGPLDSSRVKKFLNMVAGKKKAKKKKR